MPLETLPHSCSTAASPTPSADVFAATLVFLFATGVSALYVARFLRGLGIGIASGSANAWLANSPPRTARLPSAPAALSRHRRCRAGRRPARPVRFVAAAPFVRGLPSRSRRGGNPHLVHPRNRDSSGNGSPHDPSQAGAAHGISSQFVAPAITGFGLMALV